MQHIFVCSTYWSLYSIDKYAGLEISGFAKWIFAESYVVNSELSWKVGERWFCHISFLTDSMQELASEKIMYQSMSTEHCC